MVFGVECVSEIGNVRRKFIRRISGHYRKKRAGSVNFSNIILLSSER